MKWLWDYDNAGHQICKLELERFPDQPKLRNRAIAATWWSPAATPPISSDESESEEELDSETSVSGAPPALDTNATTNNDQTEPRPPTSQVAGDVPSTSHASGGDEA